jgi:hypothetical protein
LGPHIEVGPDFNRWIQWLFRSQDESMPDFT